jgi:peptide-methionine (S)-S-oxide reductase
MRQGNDVGTQYRSLIQPMDETQRHQAQASRDAYQKRLAAAGFPAMTTEIAADGPFYFAEAEHQQYLAHHPNGYCGLRGTGVTCA